MNRETILALDAINRDFYAARAAEFGATREAPWPGWERLLEPLRNLRVPGPRLRILDLGCGSGRLARWLAERLGRPHAYLGLDRSLPIVALGRATHAPVPAPRATARPRPPPRAELLTPQPMRAATSTAAPPVWILADLLASGGRVPCRDAVFDAVVAFGLFHHLPSFALRRALVEDLLRLLPSGGIAALAFWQFGADRRFEHRVLPWERAAGVDPAELEPGDRLLRWGDAVPGVGSGAMRYCHYTDPEEVDRLTGGTPAELVDSFRADGRSGALNLYRILRRL